MCVCACIFVFSVLFIVHICEHDFGIRTHVKERDYVHKPAPEHAK